MNLYIIEKIYKILYKKYYPKIKYILIQFKSLIYKFIFN